MWYSRTCKHCGSTCGLVPFILTKSTFHTASVHVLSEKAAHYMPDSACMCVRRERECEHVCRGFFTLLKALHNPAVPRWGSRLIIMRKEHQRG